MQRMGVCVCVLGGLAGLEAVSDSAGSGADWVCDLSSCSAGCRCLGWPGTFWVLLWSSVAPLCKCGGFSEYSGFHPNQNDAFAVDWTIYFPQV